MLKQLLHRFLLVPILIGVFIFTSSYNTAATEWKFDPAQATIHFEIPAYHKHGYFGGLIGTFDFDPAFPEQAKIDAKISVSTVNTGIKMLNWHLKTKTYFDAKDYPEISFHSDSVTTTELGYYAYGKLTMKGCTKIEQVHFELSATEIGILFTGTMQLSAGDFGVGRKSKKGKDKVYITIAVHLHK